MIINAPIKQAEIDTITRKPKNRIGGNAEIKRTEKPIITDNALKTIPLPVVSSVFRIASEEFKLL